MRVEVRLYATLRHRAPEGADKGVFLAELADGLTVAELLPLIGVPAPEVHMIMVNGVGREADTVLKESDRIGLFPPVGGG